MAWFQRDNNRLEPQYEADDLVRRAKAQEEYGRYSVAEDLLKKALQIRQKELAGTEYGVLDTLGFLYVKMQRHDEAIPLFREAVELLEKEFYADHPLIAPVLDHWAMAMIAQDKWAEAEPLVQKSFDLKQKSLLMQDADTLETMRTLAEIERRLGKLAEASALLTKALTFVSPATIGPVEEFLYEQALVFQAQGKIAEARTTFEEALEIFGRRAGKSRRFASCLLDFASLLKQQNLNAEAQQLTAEAQAIIADHQAIEPAQNTPGPLFFEKGLYAATILH